jgi:hypothetical protein
VPADICARTPKVPKTMSGAKYARPNKVTAWSESVRSSVTGGAVVTTAEARGSAAGEIMEKPFPTANFVAVFSTPGN